MTSSLLLVNLLRNAAITGTRQYIVYSTTRQGHMITYPHPPIRMSPDVLSHSFVSVFRTPIRAPSDPSACDRTSGIETSVLPVELGLLLTILNVFEANKQK
jgi:hypothetical protein